uniref:Uncharacterized protein n=1 Tax=Oryza sativa subsp. japonica TaxID=39947 RepID=Q10L44_ORYSJ|nr:hypothetical protein LOC_Os03g24480 [Oryza sativa Japonica Group]
MEDSMQQVTTAAAAAAAAATATATAGGECDCGGGGGVGCLLSGIACCCAAAAFYFVGATELRMARRFTRISDLSAALDSEGALPLVTLRGQVGSETRIVASQSGCQAVIAEQQVRQHCKTKHVTKSAKTKINEKDGEEFLVLRRTKATDGDEYLVVKRTRVKVGTEHRPTKRVRDIDVEQWVHGTNVVSSTKNEVLWYLHWL